MKKDIFAVVAFAGHMLTALVIFLIIGAGAIALHELSDFLLHTAWTKLLSMVCAVLKFCSSVAILLL